MLFDSGGKHWNSTLLFTRPGVGNSWGWILIGSKYIHFRDWVHIILSNMIPNVNWLICRNSQCYCSKNMKVFYLLCVLNNACMIFTPQMRCRFLKYIYMYTINLQKYIFRPKMCFNVWSNWDQNYNFMNPLH